MAKTKLELTWIGKENRPKLEPRILHDDARQFYHAQSRATEHDIFDNRLIFGDNLLARRALESEFTGKVKCVLIDPRYNTETAFAQYDDGIEPSLWLSVMIPGCPPQPFAWTEVPRRYKQFVRRESSSAGAKMPMIQLPGRPSSAMIRLSHPSHRSLLRKVTCIKDGFFFCALPVWSGEVAA